MLTVRKLMDALKQTDEGYLDLPIRFVSSINEVEKGPHEGALHVTNRPVVGAAITKEGLFIFVSPEADDIDNYLIDLPPGFMTGNPHIDNKLKGIEPGDEWKHTE